MTAKEKRRRCWKRLVEEQSSSGQSAAAWCRAKSINVKTFGRWKRNLTNAKDQKPPEAPPAGWCQIQAKPAEEKASGLKLVIDGRVTIELEPDFNRRLLLEVLEILDR